MTGMPSARSALGLGLWHLTVAAASKSPSISRAAALWELDKLEEAVKEYRAVWSRSHNPRALGPLSRLMSDTGDFEDLRSLLDEAMSLGYEEPALRLRGNLYADSGDAVAAESEFRAAIAIGDVSASAELGYLIGRERGRFDEAVSLLASAWERGSGMAASWLAGLYVDRENWDQAFLWAWRAVTAGELGGLLPFADAAVELGHQQIGEAAFLDALDADVVDASTALAHYLARQGRLAEVANLVADVRAEGDDNWRSLQAVVRARHGESAAYELERHLPNGSHVGTGGA